MKETQLLKDLRRLSDRIGEVCSRLLDNTPPNDDRIIIEDCLECLPAEGCNAAEPPWPPTCSGKRYHKVKA